MVQAISPFPVVVEALVRSGTVGFVVDEVALGQVFLSVRHATRGLRIVWLLQSTRGGKMDALN